jgi:sugar phosphate isomerase/epimerase
MPFLSLTTWSLHRNMGPLRWTQWDAASLTHVTNTEEQPEITSLIRLPSLLAEKGFASADVCHFHFPETGEAYLQQVREAFAESGVRFYTLLADYGDISSNDEARRKADIEWNKRWIDIAAAVGAERVRVVGGDADPADQAALTRSAEALRELAEYGAKRGVKVTTENFMPLTSTADNCLFLMDAVGVGKLGLVSDFGNLKGPAKYDELARIVPVSENIHAKAIGDAEGMPDADEFARCMDIVKSSGYEGPITIVYDGPGDMWEGIERIRKLVIPYL